jgi:hypothetical protein
MMTKLPSTRIAATCSKKAGNGLTDPHREKKKLLVSGSGTTAMDFWYLGCIGFVFLAALEYGALLAAKRFCAPFKIKICKRPRSGVTVVSRDRCYDFYKFPKKKN